MRGARALAIAACWVLAACAPDLKGLEAGETGTVARVIDGDSLALDSGLVVSLTEVTAPFGEEPGAADARRALETLALGRPVRLAYGGERRFTSRRGEPVALAHVFVRTEGGSWLWLQDALVRDGLVRVRPRRDNAARAAHLLAREANARTARRGIWADTAMRVRTAEDLLLAQSDLPDSCWAGPYTIAELTIRHVEVRSAAIYLNVGPPGAEREDITLRISRADAPLWIDAGRTPQEFAGAQVRARGPLGERGGPLLCLEHPAGLEVLELRGA